jgi:hypothetical protein
VNNASLGVYATVVQSDAYRDAKLATTAQLLPDMQGPGAQRFGLCFTGSDGADVRSADIVLISNRRPCACGHRSMRPAPLPQPQRHPASGAPSRRSSGCSPDVRRADGTRRLSAPSRTGGRLAGPHGLRDGGLRGGRRGDRAG